MSDEIMGEGTLLGNLAHEHGNRATHCLIDINDEHFIVVTDKHRTPTTCRQNRPHLHLYYRFVHLVNGTRPSMKDKGRPPASVSWCGFFLKRACMFDALIECAVCGLRPRDELK